MKKIILLIIGILLLTSCTKYWYNIEYTTCNWNTWSVYTETRYTPYVDTYKEAVPVLRINRKKILNICEFKIINKISLDK